VIVVTAYDNYANDPRLAEADGYVIKDIYTDKLKQKIEEVLKLNA
jgi:two-component SAPR family response regulator